MYIAVMDKPYTVGNWAMNIGVEYSIMMGFPALLLRNLKKSMGIRTFICWY